MITVQNYGNVENVTICQFGHGTMRICSATAQDESHESLLLGDIEEPQEIGGIMPKVANSDEFNPKVAVTFESKESFDVFLIYVEHIKRRFEAKEFGDSVVDLMQHDLFEENRHILRDVLNERTRQNELHGEDRTQHPYLWNTILVEEVGEAAKESLNMYFGKKPVASMFDYRKELIEVAAVAIAAIKDLDDNGIFYGED